MTRPDWETPKAVGLLAAGTLLVFRHWLFDAQALYWGDAGLYFSPMLRFLREQLAHGTFPLWNPTLFSGLPFVGNPQAWPLYPGTLLLPLLPASAFLTVSCVLHVLLAGIFAFLWLRRGFSSLSFWPALLGAVAYMFGGYLAAKAQYPNMLQALAYIPLMLWQTEEIIIAPGLRTAVLLGTALGLQILAAHAQVTLYTIYLATLYGCFRLAVIQTRRLGPTFASASAAGLLALALSCGQWLPILGTRSETARQALPLNVVDRLHLSPLELSNFALPWRYGSPLHGDYVGPSAFWETACYAGTLTLLLALGFVLSRLARSAPFRAEAVFWIVVFAVSVWLSLGAGGGLFRLAYLIVPGFKLFHDPARLLLGAAVALPVLAAYGSERLSVFLLRRRESLAWVSAVIVLLTVVDLGQFDNGLYPLLPVAQLELTAASPIASALHTDPALVNGTGRVLTLDDLNADNQFLDWTDFRPPPQYLGRLSNTLLPNLPMAMDFNNLGGYEPLALRSSGTLPVLASELLDTQEADRRSRPDLAAKTGPLLGALGVRTVVTYRPQPLPSLSGFTKTLAWQDGKNYGAVYRCDDFIPRARRYTSWQSVAAPVAPINVVRAWLSPQAAPNFLERPWVEGSRSAASASPSPPQSLIVLRDTPDRVTLSVPVAQTVTLALLADTDFPGWRATLDGRPVPIRRADGVYRAVFVPPSTGAHLLDFQFRPEAFVLGFYVTGLAVVFLTATSTVLLGRRQNT